MLHLTSPRSNEISASALPTVIIAYKIRSLPKETPFWNAFGLWFEFSPVLSRGALSKDGHENEMEMDGKDQWTRFSPGEPSDDTFVLVATRRPESLSWTIPDDDAVLLAGVGSYNSDTPRSDDQFEQLLLMGMDI